MKVAFMPWKIQLRGRHRSAAVREDVHSLHVTEYSLEVRDTKRGQEELTADIPN